jgi:putative transposase
MSRQADLPRIDLPRGWPQQIKSAMLHVIALAQCTAAYTRIAAIDFVVVATVRFRFLYCFIVLRHDRRRVVYFNVTAHPTARWTAQQVVEAFPFNESPRFLIRDRDAIYGHDFRERVRNMGIEELVIAHRSPWQDPYVERLTGSIRRECLDHLIVFGEAHLRRILTRYFVYYHASRTHLSLDRNAIPQVGGLHHRYTRAA